MLDDIDQSLFEFENYCGSCDNFQGDENEPGNAEDLRISECPFAGKVCRNTKWRDIGCDKFWD